ncbi:MAG: hypothetical protein K0S18_793 [Anaerocolumna sp.]|nr:hypothetical protein [Anaerocolumna sp.]
MAQMVARNIGSVEVTGSIPVASSYEKPWKSKGCIKFKK